MGRDGHWVYFFGAGKADGRGDQRELLGGKGAGLAEMTRIGLPVPAGFTITTQACDQAQRRKGTWPSGLESQLRAMMVKLERVCRKKFGASKDPLLVSVRSGAAASMPGMMETILNLGLNDISVEGLAQASGNSRFAYDAYRRLIMMYGATAKGVERGRFEHAFDELKRTRTAARLQRRPGDRVEDTDVNADELAALVETFKQIYRGGCGEEFPQDPFVQLRGAIDAVFASWNAEKAVTYRRVEKITGLLGTAVNVCQMVFGNMGDDSGTGVCFTRDPNTGENRLYGDMLINAQGEDVVAGVRTPMPLDDLRRMMPDVYDQLDAVRIMLEAHYRDMQDLEFTIERGKLYMLQCRRGKRAPSATFKIAVDQATKPVSTAPIVSKLVKKKFLAAAYGRLAVKPVISKEDAIRRISATDIERLFFPIVDPKISRATLQARLLGAGIGAVPGAATGEVVFSAKEAEERASEGRSVLLVRKETSPEDVGGMHVAAGILTATGGKTSHAAVVARGWGKCCIVGCGELKLDEHQRTMTMNGRVVRAGESVTLDGATGEVFEGALDLIRPSAPDEFDTLMGWCDERRTLGVRANADTPADAVRAIELGAEGIGLCRTEHMFFDASQPDRIIAMRQMILASTEADRRLALDRLLPFQRQDFEGIFEAMNGKPVTIRLIDPPLHEFLPQADNIDGLRAVTDALNAPVQEEMARVAYWDQDLRKAIQAKLVTPDDVRHRVDQMHEANPMLGHRGCRLCITYPEILEMQVRAIIEAALNCTRRKIKVLPEIMIPLSIDGKELELLVRRTRAVADVLIAEQSIPLKYSVGTMIETPRAAILADRLAAVSDFFSFGTNDLTQLAMGLSRDDSGRFLPEYVDTAKSAIFTFDPFQTLDADGVGELMRMAIAKGRSEKRTLKLGMCGEHGGDPTSIAFSHEIGLDYVSCSPFRVPVARLAAAQAAMSAGAGEKRKASARQPRGSRTNGNSRARKASTGRHVGKATAAASRGRGLAKVGAR